MVGMSFVRFYKGNLGHSKSNRYVYHQTIKMNFIEGWMHMDYNSLGLLNK